MLKEELLDNVISQYYDKEMNHSELLSFEARMTKSDGIREYTNNQCDIYYKISYSIKSVKERLKADDSYNKLFININSVRSESFYKHLRNGILNILRNHS